MKRTVDPSMPVHVAVKEAVSTLEECHPTQLGSLSLVVDGERLDGIVDRAPTVSPLQFPYCGYTVTVNSNGQLCVQA
jgi:hypothetical protein